MGDYVCIEGKGPSRAGIMANTWFARSIVILGREVCIRRGGEEGCITMGMWANGQYEVGGLKNDELGDANCFVPMRKINLST